MKNRLLFLTFLLVLGSCASGVHEIRFPEQDRLDLTDSIFWSRLSYYSEYVLTTEKKKTDGAYIAYEDIVVPYRYGSYNGYQVLFITYLDPENSQGKMDVTPYEKACVTYGNIEVEFVGNDGYPYVWKFDRSKSYRSDLSENQSDAMYNGAGAAYVRSEFLEFEEALKLGYFSDDDLRALATSANEIRDNPSLWHWTNEE